MRFIWGRRKVKKSRKLGISDYKDTAKSVEQKVVKNIEGGENMKHGFRCKLCGSIVNGEVEMIKHIVNEHKPLEFFDLVFIADWKVEEEAEEVEKPKPKRMTLGRMPKPELVKPVKPEDYAKKAMKEYGEEEPEEESLVMEE